MDVVAQKGLCEIYRGHAARGLPRPDWHDLGFRIHSEHDEDGILLYIFSLLGLTNRKLVEICCGNGAESNTANLLINHRCVGLLFDGDAQLVEQARSFYAANPSTRIWPPKILHQWVTAENVSASLANNDFTGEIDLLSIDIDGIDYWLWKALDVISPRVVVTEINHLWGPEISVTVPYSPDFKAVFTDFGSEYAGASIAAFMKLATQKGYRLVGGNAIGTNVFFVRNDLTNSWLPAVTPESLFWHPRARFGQTVRAGKIKDMHWETI